MTIDPDVRRRLAEVLATVNEAGAALAAALWPVAEKLSAAADHSAEEQAKPVTVGELVDALATYPRDALVLTGEAGTGMGTISVRLGGKTLLVWDGTTSAGNWHEPESIDFDSHRPRHMAT